MARVHRLTVYPIKSLDGVSVDVAEISEGGALKLDRQWAMADRKGRWLCGKRTPQVYQLRAQFDLQALTVQFSADDVASPWWSLETDTHEIQRWLSDYFQQPVTLERNPAAGFPDDPEAYGPTLISEASLLAVQSWFPDLTLDNLRARFRANIELTDTPAFWEDQLFSSDDLDVRFEVGEVEMLGSNPCQRCGVPMRDPFTGKVYLDFYDRFIQARSASLPEWADREAFDHFYRLSLNTRVPHTQAGKCISVGDPVQFTAPDPASMCRFP